MRHTYDVGWGWWLVMAAEMTAFWAVVIYVLVRLTRGASSVTQRRSQPAEAPLAVLKRRLAAGEISVDEHEALRVIVEESGSPTATGPAGRRAVARSFRNTPRG